MTPSVSSTSVTAMREYATWVVATATTTAVAIPASVPTATRPSHQAAADAEDAHGDGGDARRPVRRVVEPQLRRREDEEEKARVVVPARIETTAVGDRPGPRNDARLVGVEQRQRQSRGCSHRTQKPRQAEDGPQQQNRRPGREA